MASSIACIGLCAAAALAACSHPARKQDQAAQGEHCVVSDALSCAEQQAMVAIRRASKATPRVWGGFRLARLPLLLVSTANATNTPRGILLNPSRLPLDARRVAPAAAHSLSVYRLDSAATAAARAIGRTNGRFDNFFALHGMNVLAVRYTPRDARGVDSRNSRWLDLVVHESFHVYQQRWRRPDDGHQDESRYPSHRAVLELGLLEARLAVAALREHSRPRCEQYLEQLVAVRAAKLRADTGRARLVRRMDGLQEAVEGSAEHVERRVRERLSRLEAPCVAERASVVNAIIAGDIEGKRAREFFSWELFYLTGAAWLSLLECSNVPYRAALEAGAMPYDVAKRRFSPSHEALASAKREQDFAQLRAVTSRFAIAK